MATTSNGGWIDGQRDEHVVDVGSWKIKFYIFETYTVWLAK